MSLFRRPRWLRRPWWERPAGNWPVEPSPTAGEVLAELDAIDGALAVIGDTPPTARTPQQWAELDRLLDRRMRLTCPSVPVVPGRSS